MFAISVPYLYLVFLRQQPEYQRTFPANRPALYRAGYGDARPDETFLFGFPHRDGWKVIAELYRRGVLHGDYNTNQKPEIAGWYTRSVPQCDREPANYIVAWGAAQLGVPAKYRRAGDVYVDGVRALSIFQRAAPPQPPQRYDLADYRAAFDAQRLAPFPTAPLLGELTPQHPLDARWPGGVWLRGYDDFENLRLAPGATTTLLLYWQPTQPLGALDLALDLVDAQGRTVASAAPACGTSAPADWPADTLTTARYTITPGVQTPPGTYTLRVALRRDGQALRLANGADALAFANLYIGR